MNPPEPVVYLPGIDGTGRLLFRQEQLNSAFAVRCVSYPQDDRHTYADLVKLGIRTLEETGPAAVVTESFGGAVALMIALERPDLVARLVMVNTFAYYPWRLGIDVLREIGRGSRNRPAPPVSRRLRGYFFFGPGIPTAVQYEWWRLTADVPLRAYGHRFRLLREIDLRPRLAEVKVPAVVFVASNDWVVPAPAGRLLAKRLPHAKLITVPAGHAAMVNPRVDVCAWLKDDRLWPAGVCA